MLQEYPSHCHGKLQGLSKVRDSDPHAGTMKKNTLVMEAFICFFPKLPLKVWRTKLWQTVIDS